MNSMNWRDTFQKAQYIDPQIPDYRGNPLIEALPAIFTKEQVINTIRYEPPYEASCRDSPEHLRLHLTEAISRVHIESTFQIDLEQRVSRVIRVGYCSRNPSTTHYWRDAGNLRQANNVNQMPRYVQTTAAGFGIVGHSGIGKTRAIEAILSLYPQVIVHSEYHDEPFSFIQITWLKLDCPHDGSLKALCKSFFDAVDRLIGTNYYGNYVKRRSTVDDLLSSMMTVISLHAIGVLVIDEIQNLHQAKSGGPDRMLNFFVYLDNEFRVPVIPVGTPKAISLISTQFRQQRRLGGKGDMVLDRMKLDEEWQYFVEELWRYQYVQKPCCLTAELNDALYYESQGITDLVVKVFALAQIRAIVTGMEVLTPDVIHSVSDNLKLIQPMLKAIREGDPIALAQYEDYILDIDSIVHDTLKHTVAPISLGKAEKPSEDDIGNRVLAPGLPPTNEKPLSVTNANSELTRGNGAAKSDKSTRNGRKNRVKTMVKGGLLEAVETAKKQDMSGYEALKQASFICEIVDFL